MTACHVDFETFSEAGLFASGADAYARHPSTDILCMCWAIGDGPVALWRPGEPFPAALAVHIAAGGRMVAWNAAFERLVWRHVARGRYGFPPVADDAWWCAAAQAANMALPRALDDAAGALAGGVPQKDMAGRRVMLQLSQPRRPTQDDPRARWTPAMAPAKFDALYRYCEQDVHAERAICARIYALSERERTLYLLDQRINDRGVRIDRTLIGAATRVVNATTDALNRELAGLTGNRVTAATQVAALTQWAADQGVPVDSLAADVVGGLLARPNLPWAVEKALLIRQEVGKSSTAKLRAMLDAAGPDDRIRGSLLYYGASRTGRWSGRLHQPQNYPRGDAWLLEKAVGGLPGVVDALLTGNPLLVRLLYGSPMAAVSTALRACMIAGSGHDLMACDFSNIEGRVLAWCAGEAWKLDAFRAFDAGRGPDLYVATYARCFGVPVAQVDKSQRQVGKVIELAAGYQGWIGAFHTFAKLYGVRLPDDQAAATMGAWREAHPAIADRDTGLWARLNRAALRAVAQPGVKFDAGPVTYLCRNDYLWCRLPSGRMLAYARPTIEQNDRGEDAVHFWTVPNPQKPWKRGTGKWAQVSGYGGMWAENVVQAISRDLLAEAMLRLEAAGYPLVLTVHDELVAELPKGRGDLAEMERIAAEVPRWASGLPVAAAGWRNERYQK